MLLIQAQGQSLSAHTMLCEIIIRRSTNPPNPTERNTLSRTPGTNLPTQAGKPSFAQIKTWIDADRPIMARIPGHMRIIPGKYPPEVTWSVVRA